jgi:hypothetical protein
MHGTAKGRIRAHPAVAAFPGRSNDSRGPRPSRRDAHRGRTTDEISPVVDMRFRGAHPSSLRLGNTNVAGQGLTVLAGAERGFAYRTGLHLHAKAYQVFGRPYTLSFVLDQAPLGRTRSLSLGYPFLTGLQRNAWYLGYDEVHEYASFVRPGLEDLSLEVRRRFWGLGGVRRLGIGRESAFVGALVSHEDMAPARHGVIVSDSGLVADTTNAFGGPPPSYRNVRFNAVLGARILSFTQARGFDALLASQDIATGVQLGVLVGRGIPRLGSAADDLFASADLYTGLGSPRSFASMRIGMEARRDARVDRWDSMVGSGRVAWYAKPSESHLVISSVEMAGGWRSRVPFQLRLGDQGRGCAWIRGVPGRWPRARRGPARASMAVGGGRGPRRPRMGGVRGRRSGLGGRRAHRPRQRPAGGRRRRPPRGLPSGVESDVASRRRHPGGFRPRCTLGGAADKHTGAALLARAGRRGTGASGRFTRDDLHLVVRSRRGPPRPPPCIRCAARTTHHLAPEPR